MACSADCSMLAGIQPGWQGRALTTDSTTLLPRGRPWRRNPNSKLSAAAVEAAAAQGHAPAPADLPQNEFIYYVWVCEIMSQQVNEEDELPRRSAQAVPALRMLSGNG